MSKFAVIIAAAGQSRRFNDVNFKKPFVQLNQKPVWLFSAELFQKRRDVKQVIIVISPDDKEDFYARFGPNIAVMGIDVVLGGAERSDSVQNGLAEVDDDCQFVAIHDAARPCIDADLVESVFDAGRQNSIAIPAVRVHSTVKKSADGKRVDETIDRNGLYLAQTPQVFEKAVLQSMFANRGDLQPTDEAQLAEMLGHEVTLVEGSPFNIKITTKQDLRFAKACLAAMPAPKLDAPIHPFADDNLFR